MTSNDVNPPTSATSPWPQARTEPIVLARDVSDNEVHLTLDIPPDLFQLRGHFPKLAIVPGVAQLDWALNFARCHFALTGDLRQVTQLKYRRVLKPGDAVGLNLQCRNGGASVVFSFAGPDVQYSSGILKLAGNLKLDRA
jgi:3-hydroxymyristoyl/3-hydroxydecanoyl-(acyl carrier protein) dehydratase